MCESTIGAEKADINLRSEMAFPVIPQTSILGQDPMPLGRAFLTGMIKRLIGRGTGHMKTTLFDLKIPMPSGTLLV
jgi:hypothetical protein